MRVGIDVALAGTSEDHRRTGVSRYVTELVAALGETLDSRDTIVPLGPGSRAIRDHVLRRIIWQQTRLPRLARGVDVLHGPVNTLPLRVPVPTAVTVHDLAFLRYPDHISPQRRLWLAAAIRHSVRVAGRMIVPSQVTADDLGRWLGLSSERLRVVPLAPAASITDGGFPTPHIDGPYLVAVGTLEPRKNLSMLLRAFAAIRDAVPHRLVLVGPQGWRTGPLRATITELGLGDRLVLTGFVSDAALGGWYAHAELVVVPSLYEGFGLPLVEAMACGAPVLAAGTSALPEVGVDAARYADPNDPAAWSVAMRDLLGDDIERDAMRRAGLVRAAAYSWASTARQTWDVYREAAG